MPAYRHIPTLFQKRLVLLAAAMLLGFGGLTAQLLRVSVVEGGQRRRSAEARLSRVNFLATYRGSILDRRGRPLAQDRASYDVAVPYGVITGTWEIDQAARAARKAATRAVWRGMSPAERDAAIQATLPKFQVMAEEVWQSIELYGRLSREEVWRRRDDIMEEVEAIVAAVVDRQRESWEAEQGRRRSQWTLFTEDDEPFKPQRVREETITHVILPRVDDETAHVFQRLAQRLGNLVEVRDSTRREYPAMVQEVVLDRSTLPRPIRAEEPLRLRLEGVADHMIGAMRDQVWAEDVARRPFGADGAGNLDLKGYRYGDALGAFGLEQQHEDLLRGTRGMVRTMLGDGAQERIEPVPGADLRLTIDIDLQARIQAILSPELGLTVVQSWHQNRILPSGRPLHASAVVLEVATGAILAQVTNPTLAAGRRMTPEARALSDVAFDRASAWPYPPGSIIKPLVLAGAVHLGRHELGQPIHCTGHYFPDVKDSFRCWLYREQYGFETHGDIRAADALGRSCNVYFYTLADRMGLRDLSGWFRRFGLDQLPGEAEMAAMEKAGEARSEAISMGIGQGRVTWTLLQAAGAYATLARRGVVIPPTLLLEESRARTAPSDDLGLAPDAIEEILKGLRRAVADDGGTGHRLVYADGETESIFNASGVTVWGKTGTAQAPPLRLDTDGDGQVDARLDDLDHAWFVGLVGPEDGAATFAIAVLVEFGGSGGRVSGPVANQIIHALQRAGYLPGGAAVARPSGAAAATGTALP